MRRREEKKGWKIMDSSIKTVTKPFKLFSSVRGVVK